MTFQRKEMINRLFSSSNDDDDGSGVDDDLFDPFD